jgi:hypothetical protein
MIVKYSKNRCSIYTHLSSLTNLTQIFVFNELVDQLQKYLPNHIQFEFEYDYFTGIIRIYDLDDIDHIDYFIYQINNLLDRMTTLEIKSDHDNFKTDMKYTVEYSNGESYCIYKKEEKE